MTLHVARVDVVDVVHSSVLRLVAVAIVESNSRTHNSLCPALGSGRCVLCLVVAPLPASWSTSWSTQPPSPGKVSTSAGKHLHSNFQLLFQHKSLEEICPPCNSLSFALVMKHPTFSWSTLCRTETSLFDKESIPILGLREYSASGGIWPVCENCPRQPSFTTPHSDNDPRFVLQAWLH